MYGILYEPFISLVAQSEGGSADDGEGPELRPRSRKRRLPWDDDSSSFSDSQDWSSGKKLARTAASSKKSDDELELEKRISTALNNRKSTFAHGTSSQQQVLYSIKFNTVQYCKFCRSIYATQISGERERE